MRVTERARCAPVLARQLPREASQTTGDVVNVPDASKWTLSADTRRPRPEVIEDRIHALIARGELPSGEHLPNEHELARRFGVGRSSVRTALQRLQLRGLVDVARGRGWLVVAQPPVEADDSSQHASDERRFELAQLFEVRIVLEMTATDLAALNATPEEIGLVVDAFEEHRSARSEDEIIRTDELFHARIMDASHNTVLRQMYDMLTPELRQFRRDCIKEGLTKQSSDGHSLVLQFLRNHDGAGARTAMASHLLSLASRLGHVARTVRSY